MLVLGIETSCDETAAAVVDDDGTVVSDVVASQIALHAPHGGIVPELASRAHLQNMMPVVTQALAAVPERLSGIDAVAVTRGPGLMGALLTGLQFAKTLAWSRKLPLVGVDHLTGHLFSPYLSYEGQPAHQPAMPFIGLIVSGGHTSIYRVGGVQDVEVLGQTRDDAAGEAFDKIAKLMGLPYPGGPIIDRLAAQGDPKSIDLPTPMASMRSLDFSFSGLKSAVSRLVDGIETLDEQQKRNVAAAFQARVVEVLARKAVHACEITGIGRLVVAGGVAANLGLRAALEKRAAKKALELFIPPTRACTDNAAMIAYAGSLMLKAGIQHDHRLTVYSRRDDVVRGKFPKRQRRSRPSP